MAVTAQPVIHGRAGEGLDASAFRTPNKGSPEADGFDLYRLDCAVDALRGQSLSANDRAELARIAANLADIMEPIQ